jgi:hypothetical protein
MVYSVPFTRPSARPLGVVIYLEVFVNEMSDIELLEKRFLIYGQKRYDISL